MSSLSSFIDDGCHKYFEEKGIEVALLGSLANDRSCINQVLDGDIKCCKAFMWDSGAISVRNKKTEITLEKYVEWVKDIHESKVPLTIVALDVIGNPVASQNNYLRLKYEFGFGNNFLPVFHYGEPREYLDYLLKEDFKYIGLGGVGAGDRASQDNIRDWLRDIFFVNGDGRTLRHPDVKFHGFAITSKETLDRFPFYSVDSATWVKNSAIGKILTPFGDWRVSNDPRSGYDTQHIKRAAVNTRKRVEDWIRQFGFTLEQVADGRFEKHIVNISYFLDMENNHNWEPSSVETISMFTAAKDMGIDTVQKDMRPKIKLDVKKIKAVPILLESPLPPVMEPTFNAPIQSLAVSFVPALATEIILPEKAMTMLLYLLMRDVMPVGDLIAVVKDVEKVGALQVSFTNKDLEKLATSLLDRLKNVR